VKEDNSLKASEHILSAQGITYSCQDGSSRRVIIDDLSYDFSLGTFYVIFGRSGSGKTTLLSLLGGLDVSQEGSVLHNNEDIRAIGLGNYRRNRVGIVFQSYNLVTWLNAVENVLVAMNITDNVVTSSENTIALNLLEYLGIDNVMARRRVTKLSGGEQQRVAIARALATDAMVILADEPTGNLDDENSRGIVEIFKCLAHEHNKCVIVVSHSTEIASRADILLRLNKGKLEIGEKSNALCVAKY
jgi:putative ABC transport system ATP-binding protein